MEDGRPPSQVDGPSEDDAERRSGERRLRRVTRGRPASRPSVPIPVSIQTVEVVRASSASDFDRIQDLEDRVGPPVLSWPLNVSPEREEATKVSILAYQGSTDLAAIRSGLRRKADGPIAEVSTVFLRVGAPLACLERFSVHPRVENRAPVVFRALERLAAEAMFARARGLVGFARDFDLGLLGRLGFRPVGAPVETAEGWLTLLELPLMHSALSERGGALASVVGRVERVRSERHG